MKATPPNNDSDRLQEETDFPAHHLPASFSTSLPTYHFFGLANTLTVTSVISAHRISAQKPDHNSVQLYVLITILINTYYITFYITHSYR
jgi:hypothetical protein